jgi:hypothetical protein
MKKCLVTLVKERLRSKEGRERSEEKNSEMRMGMGMKEDASQFIGVSVVRKRECIILHHHH